MKWSIFRNADNIWEEYENLQQQQFEKRKNIKGNHQIPQWLQFKKQMLPIFVVHWN
jgi:hypothetical protein